MQNVASHDIRSIRCRLYPTPTQEKRLLDTLDICRDLYNHFVSESRLAYKEGYKINFDELQRIIPALTEGKEIYAKVAQVIIHQFYRNLSVLKSRRLKTKRKIGNLRFKSKLQFKSFTYNQSGFKIISDNNTTDKLKLSKIGRIKIIISRHIEGVIKEIHIKLESSGKWFANIITSKLRLTQPHAYDDDKIENNSVGIDVGINNFAYDSDGRVIAHPSILSKSAKKLSRTQRVSSRRVKGSKNREKQRIKVARVYEKIYNQRRDFLHKASSFYVNKYNGVFVEDLKIDNMVRNHNLAKSIHDSSWYAFFSMLEYKAASAGVLFHKVNPHGTSQRCSNVKCGKIVKKALTIRTHSCPYCNLNIDRDYNASINIKKSGLDSLSSSLLLEELKEVTPVEIEPIQTISDESLQARSMNQEINDVNL